jgi:hypothetical protein
MIKEEITQRYAELAQKMPTALSYRDIHQVTPPERTSWKQWAASALNLIGISFGKDSTLFLEMEKALASEEMGGIPWACGAAIGVFTAARDDYNRGFATALDQRISGEIFGDLLNSANAALQEGYKDSAAVLAAAAFEDSLKKIGVLHGLEIGGRELQDLVNLLKAQQILTGASGKIAGNLVKTRNAAMHADWNKITAEEVGGLIGFVRQMIVQHLS